VNPLTNESITNKILIEDKCIKQMVANYIHENPEKIMDKYNFEITSFSHLKLFSPINFSLIKEITTIDIIKILTLDDLKFVISNIDDINKNIHGNKKLLHYICEYSTIGNLNYIINKYDVDDKHLCKPKYKLQYLFDTMKKINFHKKYSKYIACYDIKYFVLAGIILLMSYAYQCYFDNKFIEIHDKFESQESLYEMLNKINDKLYVTYNTIELQHGLINELNKPTRDNFYDPYNIYKMLGQK
jgi:hypothetical protein